MRMFNIYVSISRRPASNAAASQRTLVEQGARERRALLRSLLSPGNEQKKVEMVSLCKCTKSNDVPPAPSLTYVSNSDAIPTVILTRDVLMHNDTSPLCITHVETSCSIPGGQAVTEIFPVSCPATPWPFNIQLQGLGFGLLYACTAVVCNSKAPGSGAAQCSAASAPITFTNAPPVGR